jgi:hypothetical protein
MAFFTSLVADTDVLTDWAYFQDVRNKENDPVPKWIKLLPLTLCMVRTYYRQRWKTYGLVVENPLVVNLFSTSFFSNLPHHTETNMGSFERYNYNDVFLLLCDRL